MKINGLTLKKIVQFKGHEGEPCFQGDLYLGSTKIAEWSQDSHGAVYDNLRMETGYSEEKLRDAIISNNEPVKYNYAGESWEDGYSIEELAWDLIVLKDCEKSYKKAIKDGYAGYVEVRGHVWTQAFAVTKTMLERSDADLAKLLSFEAHTAFEKGEATIHRFTSTDDFNVGKAIKLADIRADVMKI